MQRSSVPLYHVCIASWEMLVDSFYTATYVNRKVDGKTLAMSTYVNHIHSLHLWKRYSTCTTNR